MEVIKTVGVVGAGVIGASWTALFLYKEFKVNVYDPYPIDEAVFKKRISANLMIYWLWTKTLNTHIL